jgi:DNA polymerase III epsilon subunit-like protein
MWKDAKAPHMTGILSGLSKNLFKETLENVPHREVDFSAKAVEEMRLIVKNAIDESPSFKWAVENFGMQFVVKRTKKAVDAFNNLPEQKAYVDDLKTKGIPEELISTSVATTYGTSRTTFFNSGIDEVFKFGEQGYTTPSHLAVIDETAGGALRHEWGHFYMSSLLDDDELPTTSRIFGGKSMYAAKSIAEKYNTEIPLSQNLLSGRSDQSLPFARSAYAHTSMNEMFAEGVAAYMHPNEEVKHFAINDVLKKDIESSVGIQNGEIPWNETGLSSGGRKSRRNNPDQLRLDIELPDEKLQRGRENQKTTNVDIEPRKPNRPREPDNGPMTGKFTELFKGVSSWEQFREIYNSLDIIYFDYETTGLGDSDRPIQLGAVRIKGGKVIDRFNMFMNPEKELSQWSLDNLKDADGNPLTQEWVSRQTTMKEAHAQFIAWAGENPLLGGQYTPFDLGFLERTLKEQNLNFSHAGVIDSKAMADELLPRWSEEKPDGPFSVDAKTGKKFASSSLGPVAEFLDVDMGGGWHTADVDSETSALIVGKMIEYGISNPEAPRTILDVEGIPRRQDEKRIKYAQAMARYEKAKKQYEIEKIAWDKKQKNGEEQ